MIQSNPKTNLGNLKSKCWKTERLDKIRTCNRH